MTTEKKFWMVCNTCGSQEVASEALSVWNVERQDWEIYDFRDDKHCDACDDECFIDDVEIIADGDMRESLETRGFALPDGQMIGPKRFETLAHAYLWSLYHKPDGTNLKTGDPDPDFGDEDEDEDDEDED